MEPNIIIRRGCPEDIEAVMGLILELADYEKGIAEVENNVEQLLKDSFGAHPVYYLWVAERVMPKPNAIIGAALCYLRYSTWKGKRLYLEDIIVTKDWRKKGVGRRLLEQVFRFAYENKLNGVTWQVLDWNEPALLFYRKYNVKEDPTWVNCEITKAELERLLAV
jgi:GNAT superfamily N-acetyltransferase